MLTPSQQIKSLQQLKKFMDYWEGQGKWQWAYRTLVRENVNLFYKTTKYSGINIQIFAYFYNDGRIELDDHTQLDPDIYYTGFNSNFQKFSFSSHNLLITAKTSAKMPQGYTVTISL